jgi:hypothetical protein
MTLTIDLPPHMEEQLVSEARKRGLAPTDYARRLIESQLPPTKPEEQSLWETLSTEAWIRAFQEWVDSHDYVTAPPIPLEALRRENLYEDRV